MARSLKKLHADFRGPAEELIERVSLRGYTMRPFYTHRTVRQQAKLWRQSRSRVQIDAAISVLFREKANFLACILEGVGPQHGRWATNALPGQSWHNWRYALDCFLQIDGKANWDSGHEGYRVYAETAVDMGMTAGYYWRSRDAVHVQQTDGRVLDEYSWQEIDARMRA